MNDMRSVIVPKSDQLNADDLIAGPLTITITKMDIRPGTEQPVSVAFDGDGGKPYKPCKSMARVMVNGWGPDANKYIGQSMTIYRDPSVKWGGMEVGGIRISHMTGIDRDMTMALTQTKGSKKLFTVKKMHAPAPQVAAISATDKPKTPAEWLAELEANLLAAETRKIVDEIASRHDVLEALEKAPAQIKARINAMVKSALERTATAPADDSDGWPGPVAGEVA